MNREKILEGWCIRKEGLGVIMADAEPDGSGGGGSRKAGHRVRRIWETAVVGVP